MKKALILVLLFSLVSMISLPLIFAADEPETIDIAKWNSPIKSVLETNNVRIDGVELENKTTYILYVGFPKELKVENESYFTGLIQSVAKANQFQSFRMEDSQNDITIEVACQNGAISSIIINKKNDYFQWLKASQEKEKQLVAYLTKQVPELKDLEKMVLKATDGKGKMIIYVNAAPQANVTDKYEKDYYILNVDMQQGEDTTSLDQFYVNKDLTDIAWHDDANDKYLSLDEWRKMIATTPYWPDLFK